MEKKGIRRGSVREKTIFWCHQLFPIEIIPNVKIPKMDLRGGSTARCIGAIHPKEDGIQGLVGWAPSSQTVGSLFRVIHEQTQHSTWTTEANIALVGLANRLLSPSTHPSRAARCIGAIHPKEDGIQELVGWAPSSQTVGSLFRVIHEQIQRNTWITEANIVPVGLAGRSLSPSSHP